MTIPASLLAMLQALPPGAMLPVSWLVEQLTAAGVLDAPPATVERDLTAAEFGARFGRSASTVRLWCEQGRVRGAYKLRGKEWRIPCAAVDQFRKAEQGAPAPDLPRPFTGDLGDWRKRNRKAAP
jgi:hypothetical protein